MKNTLLFIFIFVFIVACSSPLDRKFSVDTFKEDTQALFSELDTSEVQLIMGTVLRFSFQKKDLTQMTYRDLLNEGKAYKNEQSGGKSQTRGKDKVKANWDISSEIVFVALVGLFIYLADIGAFSWM
jgi:hypothetical protein